MGCPSHPDVEEGLARCVRCRESFCPDCLVALGGGDPYCAACKHEQIRDLLSGTTSAFELAGLGRRFSAFLLDGFAKLVIVYSILIPILTLGVFGMMGASATGGGQPAGDLAGAVGVLFMMGWMFASVGVPFAVDLLYEALMLRRWGQTLGKMALGLKVVTAEGHDLTPGQAWGRSALKAALGSMCVVVDDLSAFFTKERTAVHDLAVKSRVARLQG